jgi:hypothetical protein
MAEQKFPVEWVALLFWTSEIPGYNLGVETGSLRLRVHFIFVSYKWSVAWSWDSAVDIATSYGLNDRGVGVRVPVRSRIFSSLRRPNRLRGPPSFLFNGYRGLFPRG